MRRLLAMMMLMSPSPKRWSAATASLMRRAAWRRVRPRRLRTIVSRRDGDGGRAAVRGEVHPVVDDRVGAVPEGVGAGDLGLIARRQDDYRNAQGWFRQAGRHPEASVRLKQLSRQASGALPAQAMSQPRRRMPSGQPSRTTGALSISQT